MPVPQWVALCLIFSWDSPTPTLLEARWGIGQYGTKPFLHAQIFAPRAPLDQTLIGTTNPLVPLGPMRQFLRCVP